MDEQQTTPSGSIFRILKPILEKFKTLSEPMKIAFIGVAGVIIAAIIGGIISGIFLLVADNHPTPTPGATQQAQALISQYYNDINNGNYQSAYSLWLNPHQSLDQFVKGYAKTRHDDITFGDITPSKDTVSVAITIYATEDFSGGTRVSTYKGTYIVGIQNGTWMILTAKFPNLPG